MKVDKIKELGVQIDKMVAQIYKNGRAYKKDLAKIDPRYYQSAKNLIHYQEFRKFDISKLRKKLNYLGLSKLTKAESHILASLITTRSLLKYQIGKSDNRVKIPYLTIKRSEKLRARNAVDILGDKPEKRNVRIMVTIPTEAALNKKMVADMIKSGMNNARINCAHDNKVIWKKK